MEEPQLFVIYKDGQPYYGGHTKDLFVKAYFDEAIAWKIARQACTSEARTFVNYGEDSRDMPYSNRKEKAKKVSEEWWQTGRYTVREVRKI